MGSFAAPIGHLSYSFRDLLIEGSDSTLDFSEDSLGLISFLFSDTTNFTQGSDLISISDIRNSQSVRLDTAVDNSSTTNIIITKEVSRSFEFPSDNEDPVDSIYYSSGELVVSVESNFENFDYVLSIGNVVNRSTNQAATFTQNSSSTLELSNYKIVLKETSSSVNNVYEFSLNYTINLEPGQSVEENDSISVSISFLNQEFDVLFGKFGQSEIDLGDNKITIDFFQDLGNKGFIFQAPNIKMDVLNSFGVPMSLLLDSLYGSKGDRRVYLEGPVTSSPQILKAPQISAVGSTVSSQIAINGNNSTLQDLMEVAPSEIGLKLRARLNPQDANAGNFIQRSSEISIVTNMEVPLSLKLDELKRRESFDLGDGLDFDEADSISIRVYAINEIPFSVLLDLEFYDESDTLVYETRFNKVIETPFLNVDGSLKQSRKNVADIIISRAGVEALKTAARMDAIFTFNTPSSQTSEDIFVKFFADAKIDITLSAVVTLSPEY